MRGTVQTCLWIVLWIVVLARCEELEPRPVEPQIERDPQSTSEEIAALASAIGTPPKDAAGPIDEDPTTAAHPDDKSMTIGVLGLESALEELIANETRVNGGEEVTHAVPYQVSIQVYRRGQWSHYCGGSIVGPHHVLTAAHCVDKMRPEDMYVLCGTLNWKRGGSWHPTVAKRVHPKFAMYPRIVNDIAVLKVSPPFNLHSPHVGAVHLGGDGPVGERVAVQVTGWGSTSPTATAASLPENLQRLRYKTLSNEECARRGFKVTASEICALAASGKGACVGDSGGPLVTVNGIPQLVGIVSHGTATCAQGRPDVYTRVSRFLPYINRVITQEIP